LFKLRVLPLSCFVGNEIELIQKVRKKKREKESVSAD